MLKSLKEKEVLSGGYIWRRNVGCYAVNLDMRQQCVYHFMYDCNLYEKVTGNLMVIYEYESTGELVINFLVNIFQYYQKKKSQNFLAHLQIVVPK